MPEQNFHARRGITVANTTIVTDGANVGFGAAPTYRNDVIDDANATVVGRRTRNSNTGASAIAREMLDCGSRSVTRSVSYNSQTLTEAGTNITTKRQDFNTFQFRNGSGSVNNFVIVNNAIIVPVGNTANRPTAQSGMVRYNSDNNVLEGYVAGAWDNVITTATALKVYNSSNTQVFP